LKTNATSEIPSSHHVEWQEPPVLTMDEQGMICDCSKAGEKLFGYSCKDLVWQPVSRLLPELSGISLVTNGEINQQLGFLSHCGHHFQAISRSGNTFMNELYFVLLDYAGRRIVRLIVQPC
jgi:PAS domain S-box-containing protein